MEFIMIGFLLKNEKICLDMDILIFINTSDTIKKLTDLNFSPRSYSQEKKKKTKISNSTDKKVIV